MARVLGGRSFGIDGTRVSWSHRGNRPGSVHALGPLQPKTGASSSGCTAVDTLQPVYTFMSLAGFYIFFFFFFSDGHGSDGHGSDGMDGCRAESRFT